MTDWQQKMIPVSVALAAAILWLAVHLVEPVSPGFTEALLALLFASTCLGGSFYAVYRARQDKAARDFFNTLARLDPHESNESESTMPRLATSNTWHDVARQVSVAFTAMGERADIAENSRAALNVKLQRLRDDVEQGRLILEYLGDPVLVVDELAQVVVANRSAQRLFGIEGETDSPAPIDRLNNANLRELIEAAASRKLPATRTAEIETVEENGEQRIYRATAKSIRLGSQSGREGLDRVIVVLRDLSHQKILEKRNAEFVSAVSHEMKSPLAGIKAYVELLVDGDAEDDETREEFLSVINSQTDRLQRLIDNLLNLSRIEAGVVSVDKDQKSLNEILEEAADVVSPSAEAKQIEVDIDLSKLYLGVLVDRDMMLQVAINLLSNAVKYTPAGGRITLRSRMLDDEIEFEVEDTGVGLSPEHSRHVFDKFYRVKKDAKMASGTGLGLPLAKHIVEDVHGGTLSVTSEEGKGSTFIVALPNAGTRTAVHA